MKPVRLSEHAAAYAKMRGFTKAEVEQASKSCLWETAKLGRSECRLNFPYGREWNGKMYETKQVRPVFVEQPDEMLVVTVYTYCLRR
jgi:hypothetical protein